MHDHVPTRLPGRLVEAWQNTPTKWYPLPVAAGALLLIVIQYRKRSTSREVVLDEHGHEVIKLKGPWHVRPSPLSLVAHRPCADLAARPHSYLRFTSLARSPSATSLASGATSTL